MGSDERNTDAEIKHLKLYLEELEYIPDVDESVKEELMQTISSGSKEAGEKAKKRLAEVYQMQAVKLASEYLGEKVELADLIQEANIGMLEAMLEIPVTEIGILNAMDAALRRAVSKERKERKAGEQLAARLNRLSDAAEELAKRYGREPAAEELADYLHMTTDEVRQDMKLSLDALGSGDSFGNGE